MPAHEHAAPNFQRTPGVSLSPSLKEVLARNANLAAQVGAAILLRRARAEGHRAARLAGHPASRNIEHTLKKILLYRRCNQFTDELANPHIS
jgi:hypothetical protein